MVVTLILDMKEVRFLSFDEDLGNRVYLPRMDDSISDAITVPNGFLIGNSYQTTAYVCKMLILMLHLLLYCLLPCRSQQMGLSHSPPFTLLFVTL